MQATYHLQKKDLNTDLLALIAKFFERDDSVTITIKSADSNTLSAEEREKAFFELFGSWQGDETADELVKMIYDSRVNSTREIDL